MNRNAKIALGCGGAGCLLLFVGLFVVGLLIYMGVILAPGIYSPNSNSNYNYNYNRNSNTTSNDNLNSNTNDTSDSSSMSDDDKHKLLHAALGTDDQNLIRRVWVKLGLLETNGALGDEYTEFTKDHIAWIMRNQDFIETINTPEKARTYVEQHFDD